MNNYIFDPQFLDVLLKLGLALILGAVIGTERFYAQKTAGTRTYALVSMGAALFVLVGDIVMKNLGTNAVFDPTRIASQIVVGVGFLGAGLIIFQESEHKVVGLTTASGLWVAAGIGMAAGFGLYSVAIIATVLTILILTVLWRIEDFLRGTKRYKDRCDAPAEIKSENK